MKKGRKILSIAIISAVLLTGFNLIKPCGGPGDVNVILTLTSPILK